MSQRFQYGLASVLSLALLAGCAPAEKETPMSQADATSTAPEVVVAEQFIDAFYAFDREAMAELVRDAGPAGDRILWYQGWAEGGNYKVVNRGACELLEPGGGGVPHHRGRRPRAGAQHGL